MNHQNIKKQRKPKEEPSPKKSQKETGKEEETQKKNIGKNPGKPWRVWTRWVEPTNEAWKDWNSTSSPNNGFVYTTRSREHRNHNIDRLGPQLRNTISATCKGISMDSEVTHFTLLSSFESSLCLDLFYMPFSHQNLINTTLTLEVGSGRLKALFAKVSAVPSGWTREIKGIEVGWKEASSTSCRIRKTWHMNWVKMCPKQLLESASEILELLSSLETLWGT